MLVIASIRYMESSPITPREEPSSDVERVVRKLLKEVPFEFDIYSFFG